MKRREFLKKSMPLTAAPFYLSGVPVSAMTESSALSALTNSGSNPDRCLVLVFLDGGNDGLDVIRKVIYKAKEILKANGRLALEISNEQVLQVSKILEKNNISYGSYYPYGLYEFPISMLTQKKQ